MFLPVNVDVPMTRLPIVNWAIIALIACATIVGWNDQSIYDALAGFDYREMPGIDIDHLTKEQGNALLQRVVTEGYVSLETHEERVFAPPGWKMPILAITSVLVHANILHLAGNLAFLWAFGNAINYKFGHLGYLALFLAAAVASGLTFYLTVPNVPVVGASGAIMGVVGAFLVFFPRNDVILAPTALVVLRGWSESIRISSWMMILLWIGLDFFRMVRGTQETVAHVSHVAGFAVGFAIALFLAWRGTFPPTRYEQTLLQVFGSSS